MNDVTKRLAAIRDRHARLVSDLKNAARSRKRSDLKRSAANWDRHTAEAAPFLREHRQALIDLGYDAGEIDSLLALYEEGDDDA